MKWIVPKNVDAVLVERSALGRNVGPHPPAVQGVIGYDVPLVLDKE